jgi:tetratricopeptide (TPR) repeat protein/outer membrane protein assembly factor BamB
MFLILFFSLLFSSSTPASDAKNVKTISLKDKLTQTKDIAIDYFSNIFVLDQDSKKVFEFNPAGELKTSFPTGENPLKSPVSLTVLKDGKIAVLDKSLEKVVVFDPDGKKLFDFGDEEGEIGSFDYPVEIKSDSSSNFYILDTDGEKVIRFNYQGLFTGVFPVKAPIAFCVDLRRNVHVVAKEGDKFVLVSFSPQMQIIKKNILNFVKKPVAVYVNEYNEFYVLDKELASVFIFNFNGDKILNFGSSSKSDANSTFKEVLKVVGISKDEKTDNILVLDAGALDLKLFEITAQPNREKFKSQSLEFDVKYIDRINSLGCKDLVVKEDTLYFISPDNTIVSSVGGKTIFNIDRGSAQKNNFKLSEPVALAYSNNQLIYIDQDENAIVSLNPKNGEAIKQYTGDGTIQTALNTPKDIACDSKGDFYIADSKNDRIVVISDQLQFKTAFPVMVGDFKRPVKLAIDSEDILYILSEAGDKIFSYNTKTKAGEILHLNFPIFLPKVKITKIKIIDNDILIAFEENSGILFLFKKGEPFSQFSYKGEGLTQLKNIESISYDFAKSNLYVSDINTKVTKIFHLMFPPDTPTDLSITINDAGYSEINWKNKFPKISHYFIYRKQEDDKNYKIYSKTVNNKLSIEKEADFVYEYAIEAVSVDGLVSGLSSPIKDEYSFCLKQRENKPEETIQNLEKFKSINKPVIDDKIILIYRYLIKKYKEEDKMEQLLSSLIELQKLDDNDPGLYLDIADVYRKSNRSKEGIAELEKGLVKFPNTLSLNLALINLARNQRDHDKVIEFCNNALLRFPDNEQIYRDLAQAYKSKKQYALAGETYNMMMSKFLVFDYYIEATKLLVEQDKIEDALGVYQKAIDDKIIDNQTDVNKAKWYSDWGKVYLKSGKLNEARDRFDQAVKYDSTTAEYYFNLGGTESKKRNKSQAISYYLKAISLDSTNADYYYSLGDEYEILNKNDEARTVYEKASKLNPGSAQTLQKLGTLLMKEKNYDLAFFDLTNAFRIDSTLKDIKNELEKVAAGREKANQKKPPVEVSSVDLPPLFPSLFNYYKRNPVGSIKLYNNRNYDLDDIRIEISSPKILTEPSIITIPVLFGGDTKEIFVSLDLSEELIEKSIAREENYDVSIKVFFSDANKNVSKAKTSESSVTKNVSLKIYSINSITWEDKKHLASFINPDDAFIRNYAQVNIIDAMGDIASQFPKIPRAILRAMEVWEYLKMFGLQYLPDPNTPYEKASEGEIIDKVQFAAQTLSKRSGDCDDFVALLSNILMSIGLEVAYIDVPGHVLLAFNSEIAPEDLAKAGLSEDMVIKKDNKIWIPLETTVIYKNTFRESWNSAIERYRQSNVNKTKFDLVDLAFAAVTYPPIVYPRKETVKTITSTDSLKEAIKNTALLYDNEIKQNLENELKENIEKNPHNVFLLNKIAFFYVTNNEYEKALAYYLEAKNIDDKNLVTLINLGNLYLLKKDYIFAELYYNNAYQIDETNPGVLVDLARLYLEKQDKLKAREFFERAQKLSPDFVSTFEDLKKLIYN